MPLPFILGAAAVAAVAAGAKKGYDGYQTKSEAESITKQAEQDYKQAKSDFDDANQMTNQALESLGSLQLQIGSDFGEFRKIADSLLERLNQTGHYHDLKVSMPQHRLDQIKSLELSSVAYLGQIAGAGAAGGAAAFAVYGGVMSLGAASTGTSITALSGAAAYNATMAAIGGGSLAAGGLGMAGGAMVLGGVVTAPILAVAGWAYNAHAEKALNHAKDARSEVRKAVTKMRQGRNRLAEIRACVIKITNNTRKIREVFSRYFSDLKRMEMFLAHGGDIATVEDKTIQIIENGYKVAAILTDIICTPLFKPKTDAQGAVLLDKDKKVQIETDKHGFQVLNGEAINSSLAKAKEDVAAFSV